MKYSNNCRLFPFITRPGNSLIALVAGLLIAVTGCETTPKTTPYASHDEPMAVDPASQVLREGDAVRIAFPGAPNLNTVQQVRRDGRITLPLVGEFKAAGLTSPEMEKEMLKLYGPQLQTKEVSVSIEASAFPIYVTGAVLRPGKILSDRPITALEAIMEAGGFDQNRANMKAVTVIRNENGTTRNYVIDLKKIMDGVETEQFSLQPQDIIVVKERFQWF